MRWKSYQQEPKGFSALRRNHRLGSAPLSFLVEALPDNKQPIVLILIGQKLATLIPVNVLALNQEFHELLGLTIQLFGGLPEIGQQIAVSQFVEVFCFGLHDLVFNSQPGICYRKLPVLLLFILEFLAKLDHDIWIQDRGLQGLWGQVCAVLTDGWEHFGGNPVGKLLCRGQLRTEHQAVEVGFWDERHLRFLLSGSTVLICGEGDPVVFHDATAMASKCIAWIAIPKSLYNVVATEQDRSIVVDGSDFSKVRVVENL